MKYPVNSDHIYTLDTVAMFAAFCLFLSTMEFIIPKPFPFMRIGLANIPIMLSLAFFSPKHIFLLVVMKIIGQGLVNGTLFSYIFLLSTAGSLLSGLFMFASCRLFGPWISLVGVSVIGALASNLVQIFLSVVFIFGESAWLIAPPFLIIGTISSIFLGILSQKFLESSIWMKQHTGNGGNNGNGESSVPG